MIGHAGVDAEIAKMIDEASKRRAVRQQNGEMKQPEGAAARDRTRTGPLVERANRVRSPSTCS